MANIFTKHPREVGETYFQHMTFALKLSFTLLLGAIVCFFHAIFPFIFQHTGSKLIHKVDETLNKANRKI